MPNLLPYQVMAHYTKPNLSKAARDRTGAFFKVLSTLAESFVFLYIGASLFISQQAWEHGHVASFVVSGQQVTGGLS